MLEGFLWATIKCESAKTVKISGGGVENLLWFSGGFIAVNGKSKEQSLFWVLNRISHISGVSFNWAVLLNKNFIVRIFSLKKCEVINSLQ